MSRVREEESEAQRGHQAIIQDSWERCREHIRRAEAADIDPSRSLWPATKHTPKAQQALACHLATIQFRDDIMGFRNERTKNDVSELWEKEVAKVAVDGQQFSVSLARLDNWTSARIVKTETDFDPVTGSSERDVEYRVLLPVAVCRGLYRHIQDVIHELGMTASTPDITPEDEAKPEHLAGLLEARGQDEALGKLPKRFRDTVEDDEESEVEQ